MPLDLEENTPPSPLMESDDAAPWVPEGRMLPPDDFRAALSRLRNTGLPSPELQEQGADLEDTSLHVEVSCEEPDGSITEATGPRSGEIGRAHV